MFMSIMGPSCPLMLESGNSSALRATTSGSLCSTEGVAAKPATSNRRWTFELVQKEAMEKAALSFLTFGQFGAGDEDMLDIKSESDSGQTSSDQKSWWGFSVNSLNQWAVLLCHIVSSYCPCRPTFALYLNLCWDAAWPRESLLFFPAHFYKLEGRLNIHLLVTSSRSH